MQWSRRQKVVAVIFSLVVLVVAAALTTGLTLGLRRRNNAPDSTLPPRPTVVSYGFVVNGSDHLKYSYVELVLRGTVTVKDRAILELDDCIVTAEQSYHKQYWLYVEGNATL